MKPPPNMLVVAEPAHLKYLELRLGLGKLFYHFVRLGLPKCFKNKEFWIDQHKLVTGEFL